MRNNGNKNTASLGKHQNSRGKRKNYDYFGILEADTMKGTKEKVRRKLPKNKE